jgi:alkaline phosphatase D
VKVLQPFLKAMPHFGIWDDHDYGPNNIGAEYPLKNVSRDVFTSYFPNSSAGQNGQGIYTTTSWGDVDLFLTDNRWWRNSERLRDSVNGKPNSEKIMFGKEQMQWLKNSLLYSAAPFKIIVVGSQVLNPVSPYDKLRDYPIEYNELMDFIATYRINGVVFLTGDRHHSEIIQVQRVGTYPLYDITVSPLTSSSHRFGGPEKDNPYRVFGLDQKQNYGKFTFTGEKGNRKMTVEFFGTKGDKLGEWSVGEKELVTPR